MDKMSLYIDRKFVTLIALKLERFVQKKDYLWTFRCPFCGDSKKNKLKTRGFFYRKKSNISFICHNCGTSHSLGNFLKAIDPNLFSEYQLERYKEESHSNVAKPDFDWARAKPVFEKKIKIDLPKLSDLDDQHPAKQYALKRCLPRLDELYYAEDFKSFAVALFPETSSGIAKLRDADQRIVIPFYDAENRLQGVQGRTISNSKIRYITLKIDDDCKKVFGLNKVDFSKTIYVVEGPLDSLFLENCIAPMDAALYSVMQTVGDHDYVFVFDNEPRNKEIVKHMSKAMATGKKICIWPNTMQQKDINDMILSGLSSQDLMNIITSNTFSDLKAQLQFQLWKKVNTWHNQ